MRRGEILLCVKAAELVQPRDHVCRGGALVERGRPFLRDLPQGRRQQRLSVQVANLGWPAVRQKYLAADSVTLQLLDADFPVKRNSRLDAHARLRGANGGLQQLRDVLLPVIALQAEPGFDRAGHRHGMRRFDRNL